LATLGGNPSKARIGQGSLFFGGQIIDRLSYHQMQPPFGNIGHAEKVKKNIASALKNCSNKSPFYLCCIPSIMDTTTILIMTLLITTLLVITRPLTLYTATLLIISLLINDFTYK
jgi:hypothetical protein